MCFYDVLSIIRLLTFITAAGWSKRWVRDESGQPSWSSGVWNHEKFSKKTQTKSSSVGKQFLCCGFFFCADNFTFIVIADHTKKKQFRLFFHCKKSGPECSSRYRKLHALHREQVSNQFQYLFMWRALFGLFNKAVRD